MEELNPIHFFEQKHTLVFFDLLCKGCSFKSTGQLHILHSKGAVHLLENLKLGAANGVGK